MAVLKLLLTGGVIFIAAIVFFNDRVSGYKSDTAAYRLPKHIAPINYDINLVLYIDEQIGKIYFHGGLRILINIKNLTRNISFHTFQIEINTEKIKLTKLDIEETIFEYERDVYNYKTNIRTLYFKEALLSGNYTLDMSFVATLKNKGFFGTYYEIEEHGKWLFATTFLPIGARQVFPCWDEPTFKSTFSVHVSLPDQQKYQILINTPWILNKPWIIKPNIDVKPMRGNVSTFLIVDLLSTYQLGIVIYDDTYKFEIINYETPPFFLRSRSNVTLQFAQKIGEEVTHFFLSHDKKSKKIQNIYSVAIPGFSYDGMSNWKLIFYREEDILYDEMLGTLMQKIDVARLVANKVAHQWFSNLISPSWWSSWRFNDALATFFGMNAINKYNPTYRIWDLFVVRCLHESLMWDYFNLITYPSPLDKAFKINSLFTSLKVSFSKEISILRMLRHLLTDKIFFDGIKEYFNTHDFLTPDDLWTTISSVVSKQSEQFNFKRYIIKIINNMNYWFKLGHMMIRVRQIDTEEMKFFHALKGKPHGHWLEIMPIIRLPKGKLRIDVPFTFTTERESNFAETSFRNINHCKLNQSILNDSKCYIRTSTQYGWVILNLQQAGYYHVNYDDKNWQRIADYLNSPNYTEIHVLNRAQIINDAFFFMRTKQFNTTSIFWNLTKYLSRETDYIAWYPMFKVLECISPIFPLSNPKVMHIKSQLSRITGALLNNIGYEENSNAEDSLTSCLRQEAAKWECLFNDSKCIDKAKIIDKAKSLGMEFMTNFTHFLVPLRNEKTLIWIPMTRDMILSRNTSRNFVLDNLFTYIDWNYNRKNTDKKVFLNNFFLVLANYANNIELDILKKFANMENRQVNGIVILIIIINNIYSEDGLKMVGEYIEQIITPVTANILYKMERNFTGDSIFTNIFFRKRQTFGMLWNYMENREEHVNLKTNLLRNLHQTVLKPFVNDQIKKCIKRKINTRLSDIKKLMNYVEQFL